MPGGRPRKPDELKILQGTWRNDLDGDPSTIIVAEGEPKAPSHLKGDALKFWRSVVPDLVKSGLAKERDAAELAMMCEWWVRYRRFSKLLDRMTNADKRLHSTTVQVAIASDKFNSIACRFGLTPSDRAKLRIIEGPKKSPVMKRNRSG